MHRTLLILTFLLSRVYAADVKVVFDLLKKGDALSSSDRDALEHRLQSKPADEQARIQLLSYYASARPGVDLAAIKAARLQHILWLIGHDPKQGLGLFQIGTRVYHLNCQGDDLADPDAFPQVSRLWLDQVQRFPKDTSVRNNAIDAHRYCAPEQAESLIKEAGNPADLGRLYAEAALGVTGYAYRTNDPAGSEAALRARPFAQQAREILENTADPKLATSAASTLLHDGAILWADGKLDWDYTPLGNRLLELARRTAPHDFRLMTLPTQLPARGQRPPAVITVGGNLQQGKLIKGTQGPPRYPPAARAARIQGTVSLSALIGPDGRIVDLNVESGPPELIDSSLAAVSRWRYEPTLLNGKPCFIITRIDVNYEIGH